MTGIKLKALVLICNFIIFSFIISTGSTGTGSAAGAAPAFEAPLSGFKLAAIILYNLK